MLRHALLASWFGLVCIAAAGVAVGAATFGAPRPPALNDVVDDAVDGQRFSLADFEGRHLFSGLLASIGDFLTGRDNDGPEADAALSCYFTLSATITRLTADLATPSTEIDALRAERDQMENRVERILERRLAGGFRAAGFDRALPLFGDAEILWPPINVEITRPPRVLAVSPRDEIRLVRTVLLDPALSDGEVETIEHAVETAGRFSAFVDRTSGVAAYPAIIGDTRTYSSTVIAAAHEWVHHYLYFYPLGFAYYRDATVRTINETVADIVASEIAATILAAYPPVDVPIVALFPGRPATNAMLRALRLEVDELLAAGHVAEAERRMVEVRDEIDAAGRFIRRINQAFFAFNGIYATTAASSSPIGPMLVDLRAASPMLADFISAVREIDSLEELEALLEDAG